jgi:hypothetical protein
VFTTLALSNSILVLIFSWSATCGRPNGLFVAVNAVAEVTRRAMIPAVFMMLILQYFWQRNKFYGYKMLLFGWMIDSVMFLVIKMDD